jgi:hypothetical protein
MDKDNEGYRHRLQTKHVGARSELIGCCWLLEQGYEVFRNVSPCGPIDLVAVKKGEVLLLDVKSVPRATVTQEQAELGVKLLIVDAQNSDRCHIEHTPFVERSTTVCQKCGKHFYQNQDPSETRSRRRKFCVECGSRSHPHPDPQPRMTMMEHSFTPVKSTQPQ